MNLQNSSTTTQQTIYSIDYRHYVDGDNTVTEPQDSHVPEGSDWLPVIPIINSIIKRGVAIPLTCSLSQRLLARRESFLAIRNALITCNDPNMIWKTWFSLEALYDELHWQSLHDFDRPSSISNRSYTIQASILNGQIVCVKRLRFVGTVSGSSLGYQFMKLKEQLAKWRKLEHHNVLQVLGVDANGDPRFPALVMPWLDSLQMRISPQNEKPTSSVLKGWISGTIEGLYYLHGQNIIHGALRASNVFLNKDGNPLLSDYGMADWHRCYMRDSPLDTCSEYRRWLAPEFYREGASQKTDVYSFGCLCIELYTGCQPRLFHDLSDVEFEWRRSENMLPKPRDPIAPMATDYGTR
ncbi:hypothetical protein QCA50_010188 [Cerrena zonata]|uniref:Protein kinase domain-containing protein n=1 Tax=Cerrena zonata TaxID=2478898 RepID=A0AAW0FYJ7_9APHY